MLDMNRNIAILSVLVTAAIGHGWFWHLPPGVYLWTLHVGFLIGMAAQVVGVWHSVRRSQPDWTLLMAPALTMLFVLGQATALK